MFTLTQSYFHIEDAMIDLNAWIAINKNKALVSANINANPYTHGVVLTITYKNQ